MERMISFLLGNQSDLQYTDLWLGKALQHEWAEKDAGTY